MPIPLLTMTALVALQVSVALVHKLNGSKGHYAFSPASGLAMVELVKLSMSCCFHIRETRAVLLECCSVEPTLGTPTGYPKSKESSNRGILEWLKMAWNSARCQLDRHFVKHAVGLAFMYLCNNNLAFRMFLIADLGTISLFNSGSGIVCAIVLWCIARGITVTQWICVLLQAFGLALAIYDPCAKHALFPQGTYLFVVASTVMTTLSGIWNEHLVKMHKVSLNVQNCCLCLFGFLFNLIGFVILRAAGVDGNGFFEGYGNIGAIGIVVSNSVIGLAITAVYKYADVMVKEVGNVVSTSILIILGLMLFGETTSFQTIIGCCVVFCTPYLYFRGSTAKQLSVNIQKSAADDDTKEVPPLQQVPWRTVFFRSSIAYSSFSLVLFLMLGWTDSSYDDNDVFDRAPTNSSTLG